METPTNEGQTGLDRRSLLKRSAIVGGAMVWTVPAVQTIAGPAFAAGSPCMPNDVVIMAPGTNDCLARFKLTPSTTCCDCYNTEVNNGVAPGVASFTCIAACSPAQQIPC